MNNNADIISRDVHDSAMYTDFIDRITPHVKVLVNQISDVNEYWSDAKYGLQFPSLTDFKLGIEEDKAKLSQYNLRIQGDLYINAYGLIYVPTS